MTNNYGCDRKALVQTICLEMPLSWLGAEVFDRRTWGERMVSDCTCGLDMMIMALSHLASYLS